MKLSIIFFWRIILDIIAISLIVFLTSHLYNNPTPLLIKAWIFGTVSFIYIIGYAAGITLILTVIKEHKNDDI